MRSRSTAQHTPPPQPPETLKAGHEYRVISLHPRWAWAIVFGGKDVENRSWATHYRGRVLVHASSKKMAAWEEREVRAMLHDLTGLPLAALPQQFERSAIIGSVELVDCVHGARSAWAAPGEVHWKLRNARPLAEPLRSVHGKLKLWRWTAPHDSGGSVLPVNSNAQRP